MLYVRTLYYQRSLISTTSVVNVMSNKQTLYFLPGTMCDQALWTSTWERLHPYFDCIHLPIPSGNSIDEIVEQLHLSLPEQAVSLIGFSLGGYLVSALAAKYPLKFSKLMVISNCPASLPLKEIKQRENTLAWLKKFEYQGMPLAKIQQLLHPNHHQNKNIIDLIVNMENRLGATTLTNQLSATTHRQNMFKQLTHLPIPIKFTFGDRDNLVDTIFMQEQAKLNDKWQLEIINDCGHTLPIEQPVALSNSIIQWFAYEQNNC